MDQQKKTGTVKVPPAAEGNSSKETMDEFFNQIQSEMRREDVSQDAVAAAFEAIQRMGFEGESEKPMIPASLSGARCASCGLENADSANFCSGCGSPLQINVAGAATGPATPAGQHHYHHHYHHHYFPNSTNSGERGTKPAGMPVPIRDNPRVRTPLTGGGLSRTEAALRKMTQDWAQACNTKQLDDLLEFYSPDATVLRPNVPTVRGAAAIREFFFGVLEAGLGEVEMEPLRVELLGDVAFEAGRCKMLVPVAMGKRREERGKYLIIFNRLATGEWKAVADSWSSDLSIAVPADSTQKPLPRKL